MKRRTAILSVLAVQLVAIGTLIFRYERVVLFGTEVRFACRAYDPYDPLRGRYLRMRVEEVCTDVSFEGMDPSASPSSCADSMYARLEPTGSNGLWRVARLAPNPTDGGVWVRPIRTSLGPADGGWPERTGDESDEAYEARRRAAGFEARVSFPNQLFVNEKVAPEAERVLARSLDGSAVAVYRVRGGKAVLTDIEVDGRPIAEKVR